VIPILVNRLPRIARAGLVTPAYGHLDAMTGPRAVAAMGLLRIALS